MKPPTLRIKNPTLSYRVSALGFSMNMKNTFFCSTQQTSVKPRKHSIVILEDSHCLFTTYPLRTNHMVWVKPMSPSLCLNLKVVMCEKIPLMPFQTWIYILMEMQLSIKNWMGPNPNGPRPLGRLRSSYTQIFSGSVKRGSCGSDFLETWNIPLNCKIPLNF